MALFPHYAVVEIMCPDLQLCTSVFLSFKVQLANVILYPSKHGVQAVLFSEPRPRAFLGRQIVHKGNL